MRNDVDWGAAWRRVARWMAAGVLALGAGCSDEGTLPVTREPAPGTLDQALACRADAVARTLACAAPTTTPAGARGDVILGGQGVYVQVTSGPPSFDAGTRIFQADLTLTNLIGQPLGTTDGSTADPTGVRIFFGSGPTNGVTLANADGTGVFTASQQPYFAYPGVLAPGATTAPKTWRWQVPAGVTSFSFLLYVSAPVPHPGGWVDLGADSVVLQAGATQQLAPVVRDVKGQEVPGATVAWSTSDGSVATVSPASLLSVPGTGNATVTATAGARTSCSPGSGARSPRTTRGRRSPSPSTTTSAAATSRARSRRPTHWGCSGGRACSRRRCGPAWT